MAQKPTQADYDALIAAMQAEFPGWQVVKKSESPLMQWIRRILFFNKTFMTNFVTSFGFWMWTPTMWESWSLSTKCEIIRHEREHFRQQKRLGFPMFAFQYLLWPLPLFYAKSRAEFEKQGYAESMRATAEYFGVQELEDVEYREFVIGCFTGPDYGWMWPFRDDLDKWYDGIVADIKKKNK
jgi:hypothetical protein